MAKIQPGTKGSSMGGGWNTTCDWNSRDHRFATRHPQVMQFASPVANYTPCCKKNFWFFLHIHHLLEPLFISFLLNLMYMTVFSTWCSSFVFPPNRKNSCCIFCDPNWDADPDIIALLVMHLRRHWSANLNAGLATAVQYWWHDLEKNDDKFSGFTVITWLTQMQPINTSYISCFDDFLTILYSSKVTVERQNCATPESCSHFLAKSRRKEDPWNPDWRYNDEISQPGCDQLTC